MSKIYIVIISISIFICIQVYPASIKGVGYGATEEESRKYALADLSASIEVEVNSQTESLIEEVKHNEKAELHTKASSYVKVTSDLPILGATYTVTKEKGEFLCKVQLDPVVVLPLYWDKAAVIKAQIERNQDLLVKKMDNQNKIALLDTLLTQIDLFWKYRTVLRFLGEVDLPEISLSVADIKTMINTLETAIDSVDFVAKKMGTKVKGMKNIYIYPPSVTNSSEVTEFASIVKTYLSRYIDTVNSPYQADYFIQGKYEITSENIYLTLTLLDTHFITQTTSVFKILPEAYRGMQIEPETINFEQLLHQGVVVSNNFKIEISSNYGGKDLLFKKDNEIELFVKMNRSGYFYIVGHILKKEEKYSYLLEINPEVAGERKFVRFINADDVNKWISIGKFEVLPPFGVETLQVIASTQDVVDALPGYIYNATLGYYLLSGKTPERNVLITRGLKPKVNATILSAESVLLYTTMEK